MLKLLAHAKINWTLDIAGRREDGYHIMDMLMESVDLGDELIIEPAETFSLRVVGDDALATEDNLVLKAARALREVCGIEAGASFTLTKHAPVGAGMGGGSADAAAVLIGLNHLWGTNLTLPRLQEIGLTVGADIPFMLQGGLAHVGGIGETIKPLPAAKCVPLLVVQPCQALSTKEVFAAFDALSYIVHPDTVAAQEALLRRDFALLAKTAGNVLQQAGESQRPQIADAVAGLETSGAVFATMTGSGSAVFGAFETDSSAQEAYRTLRKRWKKCWITHTASDGIVIL